MKRNKTKYKWKNYIAIRTRYEAKRHTQKWKKRKRNKKLHSHQNAVAQHRKQVKPFTDHPAPTKFSFVKNTNKVLEYFIEAEKLFKKKHKLNLNIDDIDELTPDAISLLVASINDKDFHHNSGYKGDAPRKPELKKIFKESGFYNFVHSRGFNRTGDGNLLHKEMHTKVMPVLAMKAALTGIRHTFGNEEPYEPLYDILIECMSNTNNHASLKSSEKCNWWLYVYNEPDTKNTSYSFLDLGVGIFDSVVVQGYLKQLFKGTIAYKNIKIVDELLAGRIQSRVDEDNEIRGKGIPQIVEYSKLRTFKEFYIITNDVKINLKTTEREQLNYNFSGTFLYWEIQDTKNIT
jgi:hypothetical protein